MYSILFEVYTQKQNLKLLNVSMKKKQYTCASSPRDRPVRLNINHKNHHENRRYRKRYAHHHRLACSYTAADIKKTLRAHIKTARPTTNRQRPPNSAQTRAFNQFSIPAVHRDFNIYTSICIYIATQKNDTPLAYVWRCFFGASQHGRNSIVR